MTDAALLVAAAVAGFAVLLATPLAITLAAATNFVDHPQSHKSHAVPTPVLGGVAVIPSVMAGALGGAPHAHGLGVIIAATTLVSLTGVIDDRIHLPMAVRVLAEALAGLLLWVGGVGWEVFNADVLDALLTVGWVVATTNALNLSDNQDGIACSLSATSAIGVAVAAAFANSTTAMALAAAVAGASLGFLPYNLSRPSRIFLGDGGSLSLGLLLGTSVMLLSHQSTAPGPMLIAAGLFLGLPLLDVALVVHSRRRRGVSVLQGGVDHLSHRLRSRLRSTRSVAALMALAQLILSLAAAAVTSAELTTAIAIGVVAGVAGAVLIAALEQLVPVNRSSHGDVAL
ncbi:MAG: UDP-GlcNAc:undecaprenyl-phosphate/decaprenyl-phosphate GlcNAc-phosphate transferase [bacterium]